MGFAFALHGTLVPGVDLWLMSNYEVTGVRFMKGVAGVAAIVMIMVGIAVLAIRITAASSAAVPPVAYGFDGSSGWQHGVVKPHDIGFGAGGSLLVRRLRWSGWSAGTAVAHGVRWADSCTPDCASGRYVKSRATLTLSGVKVHDGAHYYSRLALRWKIGRKIYRSVFLWSPGAVRGAPPFWR